MEMSASYDPPEMPDIDLEDFEYMPQPPTTQQLQELYDFVEQAPLRKIIIRELKTCKGNPENIKSMIILIIEEAPYEIKALLHVLTEHCPQYLKFAEQLIMLQ
jgi:hypothetical protein